MPTRFCGRAAVRCWEQQRAWGRQLLGLPRRHLRQAGLAGLQLHGVPRWYGHLLSLNSDELKRSIGYYCPSSTTIISCGAGNTSAPGSTSHSNCSQCAAGSYSDGRGPCTTCPAGRSHGVSFAQTRRLIFHYLLAGSFCVQGFPAPASCAAGTFSGPGASSCSSCAAGTYGGGGSASSCLTCPFGMEERVVYGVG